MLFISFFLTPNIVLASCYCTCVNGQEEAICDNAMEIRPICPPTTCPVVTPSTQPIEAPTTPPVGTQGCHQEQVLNSYTGQYEWKQICQ